MERSTIDNNCLSLWLFVLCLDDFVIKPQKKGLKYITLYKSYWL